MDQEDFLRLHLEKRKEQNAFRRLSLAGDRVDFCSNDYLGLARNESLQGQVAEFVAARHLSGGSTGSRLLSGNYPLIEEAEKEIAAFHEAEAGLIFNSGYDANIGLFSSLPQKGDTILYDQLIHASIRDGIRLSRAQSFSFLHNDADDLEKKLRRASGNIFVAIESLYSMDGDYPPLPAIAAACEKYRARLIVDEAHATGVVGAEGRGLVQHSGMTRKCFARIHTFGKALGAHGAIIVGSETLRDYLINYARSFIYTTALPPASIATILLAYRALPGMREERKYLDSLIRLFREARYPYPLLPGETPIQVLIVGGNEHTRNLAARLQQQGMDVRAILHPTVPEGAERLRIVLHSFNTADEVRTLISCINSN